MSPDHLGSLPWSVKLKISKHNSSGEITRSDGQRFMCGLFAVTQIKRTLPCYKFSTKTSKAFHPWCKKIYMDSFTLKRVNMPSHQWLAQQKHAKPVSRTAIKRSPKMHNAPTLFPCPQRASFCPKKKSKYMLQNLWNKPMTANRKEFTPCHQNLWQLSGKTPRDAWCTAPCTVSSFFPDSCQKDDKRMTVSFTHCSI